MKNYKEPIDYKKPDPEYNSGVVCTVPGQALTIKQLYQRMKAGMPLGGRQVNYDNSEDFESDDITKKPDMDYVDIIEHNLLMEEKNRNRKEYEKQKQIKANSEEVEKTQPEKNDAKRTTKEDEKAELKEG